MKRDAISISKTNFIITMRKNEEEIDELTQFKTETVLMRVVEANLKILKGGKLR